MKLGGRSRYLRIALLLHHDWHQADDVSIHYWVPADITRPSARRGEPHGEVITAGLARWDRAALDRSPAEWR